MHTTVSYTFTITKMLGIVKLKYLIFHYYFSVRSTRTKYNTKLNSKLNRSILFAFVHVNINRNLIKILQWGYANTPSEKELFSSLVTSTSFPSASIRVDSFEVFLRRGNNIFPIPDIFPNCDLE
jgi:hypothetical protein